MTKQTIYPFRASDYVTNNNFDPIPSGWYPVEVTSAEVKPTSAGDGVVLAFELTVQGENFAGRKIFGSFNLENPSEQAMEIGRSHYAGMLKAMSIDVIEDAEEMFGKPFLAKIGLQEERVDKITKKTYDARNVYKAAKPIDPETSTSSLQKAVVKKSTPSAAPKNSAPATPAWAKKKTEVATSPAPAAPAPKPTPVAPPVKKEEDRYHSFDGEKVSDDTYTVDQLREMIAGGMPGGTQVCKAGTEEWVNADSVAAPAPAPEKKLPPWAKTKPATK
jgi:hypothetical protein